MSDQPSVIEVLRRFIPSFSASNPHLSPACKRAIWAILHCRTPVMGGSRLHCPQCDHSIFTFHSCNHRSCPQCGKDATAQWVERQLRKRIAAPYFMVTFTLPSELRCAFRSRQDKEMFSLFFDAASQSLAATLRNPKWLGAAQSGFVMVLHTWNQQLLFHPHIHAIVPAAGINSKGLFVSSKCADFLVPVRALNKAFKAVFYRAFQSFRKIHPSLPCPPSRVWSRNWGVHIQSGGNGQNAIQYLGRYVCKTAIGDRRILALDAHKVTFRWTDRAHGNAQKELQIDGFEFVKRYLTHVLPPGLRAIRYYGFCHPSAKLKHQFVAFHSGKDLILSPTPQPPPARTPFACPCCGCNLIPCENIQPLFVQSIRFPPVRAGPSL
jgi:predicted nucleic acid-binding Zn ribbon protein